MPFKLLSKTKYLTGLQCPKLLWLEINDPKRLAEVDLSTRFVFDQGHLIGELAKKLFPEGINVPTDNFMENIKASREFLSKGKPLFEAGILAGRIYSRVDILRPANGNQWDCDNTNQATFRSGLTLNGTGAVPSL